MKIISHEQSRQILRNLYRKEAMEKYAEQLRNADPDLRKILLSKIDSEVEHRVGQQIDRPLNEDGDIPSTCRT